MDVFEFRIKGFHASENMTDSIKFAEGHQKVLADHGFSHISSNNYDWVNDSGTYVLIAESLDCTEILGGVRIQIKTAPKLLELEKALIHKDAYLTDFIKNLEPLGLGEVCGLWNSKAVAGFRISYILVQAALSIMPKLGIKVAIAFLAKYTLYIAENLGFSLVTDLGENGIFYYPNEYFVAGVYLQNNLLDLSNIDVSQRENMIELRKVLKLTRMETTNWNKTFKIHYDFMV